MDSAPWNRIEREGQSEFELKNRVELVLKTNSVEKRGEEGKVRESMLGRKKEDNNQAGLFYCIFYYHSYYFIFLWRIVTVRPESRESAELIILTRRYTMLSCFPKTTFDFIRIDVYATGH